uniref:Uncharacterized protein n=1 Tax=Nothobranchius furzeri TaxID=105023 RepID=A0A1A8AMH1_NOTFU
MRFTLWRRKRRVKYKGRRRKVRGGEISFNQPPLCEKTALTALESLCAQRSCSFIPSKLLSSSSSSCFSVVSANKDSSFLWSFDLHFSLIVAPAITRGTVYISVL